MEHRQPPFSLVEEVLVGARHRLAHLQRGRQACGCGTGWQGAAELEQTAASSASMRKRLSRQLSMQGGRAGAAANIPKPMHSCNYTGVQPHPTCLHCTGVSQSSAADTVPVWVVKLQRVMPAMWGRSVLTNRAAGLQSCSNCSCSTPLHKTRAFSHFPPPSAQLQYSTKPLGCSVLCSPNVVHLLQSECLPAQLPNVVLPAPLAHVRGTRIACGGTGWKGGMRRRHTRASWLEGLSGGVGQPVQVHLSHAHVDAPTADTCTAHGLARPPRQLLRGTHPRNPPFQPAQVAVARPQAWHSWQTALPSATGLVTQQPT